LRAKTAPVDRRHRAVGLGHVQCPESESPEAIRSLHEQGWSQRRIARELRLHRRTVGRYIDASKCTSNSITGSGDEAHPKCTTNPITGSEGATPSKCTSNSTTGSDSGPPGSLACQSGPKSLCEGSRRRLTRRWKRAERPAHLPGFGGREHVQGILPVGEAVRGQAQGERAAAGVAHGVPAWRRDCRWTSGWARRSTTQRARDRAGVGSSRGVELLAQGYSEAVVRQEHGDVPALPGERVRHFGGVADAA